MRNAAWIAGASALWFAATMAQPEPDEVRVEAEPSVAAHEGRPVPTAVDTAVLANLNADPRIAGREIGVKANERNAITLSGEVSSEAEKTLAGRIAADTHAVTEVRNLLVVRSE